MKKYIVFVNLLLTCFFQSQNLKITYEYINIQGDSLKSQKVILYDQGKESYFYSEAKYDTDSILSEREKKEIETGQKMSFKNLPNDEVVYYLKKTVAENGYVEFFSNEFDQNLKYTENSKFEWNLVANTSKIYLGYNLKKATVKKYNKDFIAWYCEDLPINNGPYKFFGLPGLIFEIYDTEKNHHYKIISLQKKKLDMNLLFRKEKFIEVSKEKYTSFREQFKKDPFQKIKSMISNSGISTYQGKDGSTRDMSKIIAEREKIVIAKYKLDNQIE